MNNTMSSTEKVPVWHRAPSLHTFVCIKTSSNTKRHYWFVEVKEKERGTLFLNSSFCHRIQNVAWWFKCVNCSYLYICPEASLNQDLISQIPHNVKYVYLIEVILHFWSGTTCGHSWGTVNPSSLFSGATALSPLNHQEQLKGMHHFSNGCSHTSWEENTALWKFTYLFFHGTFW